MNSIQGDLHLHNDHLNQVPARAGSVRCTLLAALLTLATTSSLAANLYWDANGAAAGAGSATPIGTWGTDNFWSAAAAGNAATAGWTPGETAVFSASNDATGTFTNNVIGTQVLGGLSVEEGNVTLSGGILSLNAGASVSVAASRSLSLSSEIAGVGWAKIGGGNLSLNVANSFTGPLTINGSAVRFNHGGAAGYGSIIVSPTSDVFLQTSGGSITLTNPITLNSGANVDVSALGGTLTLNGDITGPRSLWTVGGLGANTVVLGGNNSFSGNVDINGGTLIVTRDNALGTVGGTTKVGSGATLGFQGDVAYNAAEVIKLFGDGVGNMGALQNLAGDNQFFGPVDLQSHATIGAISGSLDLGGTIAGSTFNLTKVGVGRIIISGLGNSFAATTVNAGTLQVESTLGSGTVTVAPNAVIAGNGTIAGAVQLSGQISPSASPGTLTTGSETWEPGASYLWEINEADFGLVGDSIGWDLADIAGTLTINATSLNKFLINVNSLDPFTFDPGEVGDFDNTADYSFLIATTTGGITGFDPAKFQIDAASFSNALGFGTFVVEATATELFLSFVHPPFIVTSPVSVTKQCSVDSASFVVVAGGSGSLNYQWTRNGVPLANSGSVSGADTATLTINPVVLNDSANYACVVTNIYGMTTSAVALLTVVDTIAPILVCPADVSVNADAGECFATGVGLGSPGVTEACDIAPTLTNNAPVQFPVGTTVVTWGVTDGSGNHAECQQNVTVVDNQSPTLTVNSITRQLDNAGNYTLTAADLAEIVAAADDNCGLASTNASQTVFNFCHVAANNVTITVTDIHGNPANAVVVINITAPPMPTVVYVDDDYPGTCAAVNFPSNGVAGPYYVGFNAFDTIQAAVDAVAAGGTVNVAAGEYSELVEIGKAVSVLGPNAGINPNTGSRVAEAILRPDTSDPDPGSSSVVLIYVTADDVTIRGLSLDGDNPALISGVMRGGADIDAIEGIASYEGVANIILENNIIKNLSYTGVDFYNYYNSGAATSGNSINANRFLNIGTTNFGYGMAILIYNNFYTEILGNHMLDVRLGIQTGNYSQANPGPTAPVIAGNQISSWRRGVFYNLHYASASPFSLTNNVITAQDSADVALWDAMLISSQQGSVTSVIGDNTINGAAASQLTIGYQVWNCPASAGAVFTGGTITDCDYGVWINNYDGYASSGDASTMTVNGVVISGASLAGVYVKDNALNSNGATVHAILNGGSVSNSAVGVLVDGADASIAPGNVALGNLSGDYIQLVNGASQNADATSVLFDGVTGAGMSLATLFATEDRIDHAPDFAGLGLVRVSAGNVYVTTNSGSIQRGINPASSGDTVNVNDGSYDAQVSINKTVTLISANGSAVTTIQDSAPTSGLGTIQVIGPTTGVQIGASGRGFTVNGIDSPNPGIEWAAVYFQGNHTNAAVIGNQIIAAGDAGLMTEFSPVIDTLTVSENEFSGQTFIGPTPADLGFGNQFTVWNVPRQLAVISSGSGGVGKYNITFTCNAITGTAGGLNPTNAPQGNTLVTIDSVGSTIENNTFTGVTTRFAESLRVRGPGANIAGNTFAGSSPVALQIYSAAAATAQVTNNSFATNYPAALVNLGVLLNAQNNWWGSASGPAHVSNPGGSGAIVLGSVDLSPWFGSASDVSGSCGFQPDLGLVYYLPDHLIFSTQPGNAALNSPLSTQPVVQVIDENGGLATQFNGVVTLTIGSNPGGGVLAGTANIPVVGGVATFTDLSITVGGGMGYTLVAATAAPVVSTNSASFDIGNSMPGITSLNPFWKRAGDPAFTLTVTGSNFVFLSEVLWDGSPRPTTYVNPTTVTALISASDIVAVGTASVSVSNPPPAGGVSGALTFRIEAAVPAVVYVDDDYTNNVADDLVNFPDDGNLGTHIIGYDAFATLQAGINAVTNTGTEYVAMGTYGEDVNLNKPVSVFGGFGGASVVVGPMGGAGSTFTFAATGLVLDGVTITRAGNNPVDWNNPNLNGTGVAMQGAVSGTVRNCLITGMRTAIDINNSGGSHILNNVITNNRTGMILRNQTDNLVVAGNTINDNWTVGVLFLDASLGSNVPIQTAANCSFISNSIAGNWYGEVVDRQTGGSLPAPGANLKNFSGNWLGTSSPLVANTNSAEPGYSIQIPVIYGGTAVAPGGIATILGTASANIDYTPWLDVGTDTSATFGFQGDFTTLHVDDNSSQVGAVTRIQEGVNMVSGSTVLVEPGNYSENISITSKVTVDGAGSGTGAGDSIVTAANAALPVFLVTDAGGTGAGDRLTIKDLRVTGGADGVRINSTSGTNQWYRIENVAAVNNSSSGVLLAGGATLGEVEVAGSVLSSNGIYGLHVANTLTLFASLNVSGGSMDQNGANGLSVYGLDSNTNSPTDISVTGTSFANNGNPLGGGEGDLSFFLFNGNAAITNVMVTADAQFPIQFRGKGTAAASSWIPLGVVHLENVTVTGNSARPGLYIVRYSDVSNVSFTGVDLSGLLPPIISGGPLDWTASVMQVEHAGGTPLNLAGLTLKSTYTGGSPLGTYLALGMVGTGGAVADCSTVIVGPTTSTQLENSVYDLQDNAAVGDIVFPVLTLTPVVTNVIAECTGGGAATVVFADPTVSADCLPLGPVISTPPSGSVFNLGTNVITAWVTDNRGVSNNVTFLVTVLDTTAPDIIACAPVTNVLADANCLGTTPDLTGLVLAADGCDSGPLLITQSPTTGTLLSLGAHPVTLTVTDPSGNFSNCVTTVTVIDLTAPVVTFWPTNRTLSVGAGCDLLVPDLTGEVVATDNCSPTNITQSPLAGTVVSYGVIPVTVTVADQYGNFTNNITALTVVDTSDPALTCPADVVVNRLDATDPYATGFATATDNCTNVVVTYNDDRSGLTNCNVTGIIYRTWTATDGASNATTCVQTVTIIDTVVPLFTSTQADITTTNDAGLCSAVVTFPTPTAVDVGYSQGFENPDWASGNYAQQPSVDWNAYSSAMNRVPSGTDGIVSKSGVAHAVIDSAVIPASPFDFTGVFGRLGAYSKVFGAGFRSSVDVYLDLNNPAVAADTYGWDVSTAANNQSGGHRRDFVFHAASDTNGNILIAADNNSNFTKRNDLASINHHTVTNSGWYTLEWVFRDNAGVLVVDCNLRDASGVLLWTETRSDPSDLIATVVGGNRYMWFTFLEVDKLAVDNTYLERNASVVCDPASGATFVVGTNEVTCVATDACGNTTTNIFTVTVNDVENPTITCPAGIVQNADAGECFATVALGASAVGDNCGVATVTNNAVSQTQFPVGTNLVTWTVTDVHSNTATCLQTVIVVDNQLPQFTCPSALTNNADLGQCSATFALPALVATDNCGVASVTSNAPPSFPVGLTPVTWTIVDIHGNTNACIQIVAILDPQLPQVTAGSIAACYETSGLAEAAAIAATSATDNCGVATTSILSTVGTCSATITVRVTDIHGNFADVAYNTRIDAVAPVIGVTTATEVQLGGPVNVKNNDCLTNAVVQGTVMITVDASDNCSFVGGQPSVTLVNGTNTETATFVIENPVGTYNYTWGVTNTTADGTWTATVAASDICHTTTTNFTLCVNKTQVTGLVQLEGFTGIGGTINHARLVTFVATGGLTNKTWNLILTNISGDTFSYTLTDVPAGTTGISAKTAWNLREKLAVTLDINGQATADFVGTPLDVWSDATDHYLRGGDFTADNQVQFFDYSILGNNFFTANPVADITGDDQVDYDDFFIMYLNWFKAGDPQ